MSDQETKNGDEVNKDVEVPIGKNDERSQGFHSTSLADDDIKPPTGDGNAHPMTEPKKSFTWDLETAISRLVNESNTPLEMLSETTYVSFRGGTAGDASAIATWYREMEEAKKLKSLTGDATNTMEEFIGEKCKNDSLEVWLENGLGDEGIPPCIFALLADVGTKGETEANQLGGIALVTLAWENSQRLLRVEWFHVDPTLPDGEVLGRRLWLRLSALALMTACQLMVVNSENVTKCNGADEA